MDSEETKKKWTALLSIVGDIQVIEIEGLRTPHCNFDADPKEIVLPKDWLECELAHEAGHIALGQNVAECFGCYRIEPEEVNFEEQVRTFVNPVQDLFVNDLVLSKDEGLVTQFQDNYFSILNDLSIGYEDPDDQYRMEGQLVSTALIVAELERFKVERVGISRARSTVEIIKKRLKAEYSEKDAAKIDQLYEVFEGTPRLPNSRNEAVELLETKSKEIAEILGFIPPELRFCNITGQYYWEERVA